MGLVLGQDRPPVPLAEDQHPVGDLRPGREHEPLRIGIRARGPGRDLHGLDAGIGQHRVERPGELPGPVTDREPTSITKKQDSRCRVTAQSTWKKSAASIVAACACRNCRQLASVSRLGAGGIFRALRIGGWWMR
jgi:hypothetical protein